MWLGFLAIMGGVLRFLHSHVENGEKIEWKTPEFFIKLLMELLLSGFAGVIAFYVCKETGASDNILAVSVAIAGHQGGKAIEFFKDYIGRKS
jgi:uncharacterized membrane protein HdeD (DUF308 family)